MYDFPSPVAMQSTAKDVQYGTEEAAKDTGHGVKVFTVYGCATSEMSHPGTDCLGCRVWR